MLHALLKKGLFQFDPETAHHLALFLLKHQPTFLSLKGLKKTLQHPINVWNLSLPNPIGLAAGFDKNGDAVDALLGLGFGFIEVGTVTPRPQGGNAKPRIFRIREKKALINRLGFNNKGVDYLVENLKHRKLPGIVGVNIGKNKTTPLECATDDYLICFQKVFPYADYIVVNISSPNTPGLRDLQASQHLDHLLETLRLEKVKLSETHQREVPLLVKTSVDLNITETEALVTTLVKQQIDGIITSNTTVDHSAVAGLLHGTEAGGLSGPMLRQRSLRMVEHLHKMTQGTLPIIGLGGVSSVDDARAYFNAGASLVQLYTGFIYGEWGHPSLCEQLCSQSHDL